jgi:Ca2+/H+ antiporter, TMEM165/GDT1 family
MRLLPSQRRGISPLFLLLLVSSATVGALEERAPPGTVDLRASDKGSVGSISDTTGGAPAARPDSGTKDAPVDGLDGKPHAGPFVDNNDLAKKPSLQVEELSAAAGSNAKDKPFKDTFDTPIDHDSVMLKDKGSGAVKGPTGTEGGVSQKDKDRLDGKVPLEKTPEQPKEASLPVGGKTNTIIDKEKDGERKKGAAGLEASVLTEASIASNCLTETSRSPQHTSRYTSSISFWRKLAWQVIGLVGNPRRYNLPPPTLVLVVFYHDSLFRDW